MNEEEREPITLEVPRWIEYCADRAGGWIVPLLGASLVGAAAFLFLFVVSWYVYIDWLRRPILDPVAAATGVFIFVLALLELIQRSVRRRAHWTFKLAGTLQRLRSMDVISDEAFYELVAFVVAYDAYLTQAGQNLAPSPPLRPDKLTALIQRARDALERDEQLRESDVVVASDLLIEECQRLSSEVGTGDSLQAAMLQGVLGECLIALRLFPSAEYALAQCYKVLKDSEKATSYDRCVVVERLIKLFRTWGKGEQVKKWKKVLDREEAES